MSLLDLSRHAAPALMTLAGSRAAPTPYFPLSLLDAWGQALAIVIVVVGCAALVVGFLLDRAEHARQLDAARQDAKDAITEAEAYLQLTGGTQTSAPIHAPEEGAD